MTDVFISYAHIDNEPDREGDRGWVERFESALTLRLLKRFGQEVVVWRDPALDRSQRFDPVIERAVRGSDLLIGAVYVTGRRAPTLVTEKMIESMQAGSVVADVSVDQGGCVETIHPTTHSNPTYVVHDVIHYGVANMPGAVPRTSTFGLTNTTLPFLEHIAARGVAEAVRSDPALALGANVWRGEVVCEGVADATGLPLRQVLDLL